MSLKQEKTNNKDELKLTITVDSKKFDDAIQNVFKKSARYFNIPGFRKGKAPFKIVERYYGDDIFYEDAFNELVPGEYDRELKENKIEAVSRPQIDVVQMEKGKDLIFTAIINTKPEVKLGKYKGISLKKPEYKVTDKDVEDELNHMAEHNSTQVSIDDLKKDIKSKKEKQNEDRAKNEMEESAIEEVCKNTKIDIPQGMIDLEIDHMEDDTDQRLHYQGLSLEKYLKMLNKSEADLRKELADDAKKNIETRLVLEQIVADEKLEADKKYIDDELNKMATQYGRKVEDLKKNEEVMDYLDRVSKNEQAIKFIIDNAKITK